MIANTVHKYCDIYLLPKEDRIDIVVRVSEEVIDTILHCSLQDGFPGWGVDFFILEKWVWGFVDIPDVEKTFKEQAKDLVDKVANNKEDCSSLEITASRYLAKVLSGKNRQTKETKAKKSAATKKAVAEGKTGFKKGYRMSEYSKRKLAHTRTGMKMSEKTKAKMSKSQRKVKRTKEQILRFANNPFKLKGEKHPKATITEKDVIKAINMYNTGNYTQKQVADKFGVETIVIKHIMNGRSWKSVTEVHKVTYKPKPRLKVTEDLVKELLDLIKTGSFDKEQFLEVHNLDRSTVNRILNGDIWSRVTGIVKKYEEPILNAEKVKEMIALYDTGNYTRKQLEKEFNVSRATVSRIFRGLIWSDVTGISPKNKSN